MASLEQKRDNKIVMESSRRLRERRGVVGPQRDATQGNISMFVVTLGGERLEQAGDVWRAVFRLCFF